MAAFDWGPDGRPTEGGFRNEEGIRAGGVSIGNGAVVNTPGGGRYDGTRARATGPSGFPTNLFDLPAQPRAGVNPPYYIPGDNLWPTQVKNIDSWKSYNSALKEQQKQLIPTSVNVRNRALADVFSRWNTPMESIYTGQGVDQAAQKRASNISQLESNAAARGLINSGGFDMAKRSNELDYLSNVANATSAGREQDRTRKAGLLQELLQIPENDLRFYSAIRGGTIPAGSLFGDNTSKGWQQFGQGLQTLVKSLSTMGAGGAMMGGMGGMGGGAGAFSAGSGGMSSFMGGGSSAFGGGSLGSGLFSYGLNSGMNNQ